MTLFVPFQSFSKDRKTEHLFKIERSKNANVVQYDAQLTPEGNLDPKKPIIAYWIMLAADGRKEDLNVIERMKAYGFKAKYNAEGNFATMDMAADIQRKIKVYKVDGIYRPETVIDGQPAFIKKIYIKSIEGGTLPKVEYMELFGTDAKTGGDRYEKLVPK
jgi:hypothetical protein